MERPSGTALVKDINPAALGSEPRQLANIGGTLLFVANDGFTGHELWRSNGTADGTVLVRDIYPGITSSGDPVAGEYRRDGRVCRR